MKMMQANDSVLRADNATIYGNDNVITGNNLHVIGNDNRITGRNCTAEGNDNTITSGNWMGYGITSGNWMGQGTNNIFTDVSWAGITRPWFHIGSGITLSHFLNIVLFLLALVATGDIIRSLAFVVSIRAILWVLMVFS